MVPRIASQRFLSAAGAPGLLPVALALAGTLGCAASGAPSGPSGAAQPGAPMADGARPAPLPAGSPLRPVATYSIVARDPETGELGVAVQSHWFSVGPTVPWAEAGVGAVATQSFVKVSYGPEGLALMRGGASAPDALEQLTGADDGREVRQVAMIDAAGHVAARTGNLCIQAAGHHVGENYSVQANLMEKDTVWPAMAKAFEAARGPLADRMLAALKAAEKEGGDIRGRQSAAMVVVSGTPTGNAWDDRIVDLRVEDNPDPLAELARLLRLQRAYKEMNAGDVSVEQGDVDGALGHYHAALDLAPEVYEIAFWVGVQLANKERVDEALPLLAKAYQGEPRLRELVPRLVAVKLLPNDDELIKRLTTVQGAPGGVWTSGEDRAASDKGKGKDAGGPR